MNYSKQTFILKPEENNYWSNMRPTLIIYIVSFHVKSHSFSHWKLGFKFIFKMITLEANFIHTGNWWKKNWQTVCQASTIVCKYLVFWILSISNICLSQMRCQYPAPRVTIVSKTILKSRMTKIVMSSKHKCNTVSCRLSPFWKGCNVE